MIIHFLVCVVAEGLNVGIIGGGLGGLSLGVGLRRVGCDVTVYDRCEEYGLGTGLTLWPNGLEALDAIDSELYQRILGVGTPIDFVEVTDVSGEKSLPNPTGNPLEFERIYGRRMRNVRWSVLRKVLRERYDELGGIFVVKEVDSMVEGHDCVVGAEGINSPTRQKLVGDSPRDAGRTIWRGVISRDDKFPERVCSMSAGEGKVGFVTDIGQGLVYWSAFATDESLSERVGDGSKKAYLRKEFGHVNKLLPMIEATPEEDILERRVRDRVPLKSIPWKGSVTLLGDSFHAMIPSLGQGANSAFEGAYRLAYSLATIPNVEDALRQYELAQIERVGWIVESSARQGENVYKDKDEFVEAQKKAQQDLWGIKFDRRLESLS